MYSELSLKQQTLFHHQFKAMGSLCQLWFYGPNKQHVMSAFQQCEQEARRFEQNYSRYLPDSMIGRLNNGDAIKTTDEFSALIHYADAAYQQSDGLFDITSGVLRKAWDFKSNQLPKKNVIDSLLEHVGWSKVLEWNQNNKEREDGVFSLPKGMEIDFGGIVKEYAADALGALARSKGIESGLVDLAGDIVVIGPRPNNRPWLINIRHPRQKNATLGSIELHRGAVASSGDYERKVVIAGKTYCHILNPKTGWPIEGVSSVSVAASHCVIAGTLSTTAMLLGKKRGKAYLVANGVEHIFKAS